MPTLIFKNNGIRILAFALMVLAAILLVYGNPPNRAPLELLNVSYDPTRELYTELDDAFAKRFQRENGIAIDIKQSHGGSGRQARAVEEGLAADVVTLGMPSDIDALQKFALVLQDWRLRSPENAE